MNESKTKRYVRARRKSDYQKELAARAAMVNLLQIMPDKRVTSHAFYQVIGELAVLAQELKSKRKSHKHK